MKERSFIDTNILIYTDDTENVKELLQETLLIVTKNHPDDSDNMLK